MSPSVISSWWQEKRRKKQSIQLFFTILKPTSVNISMGDLLLEPRKKNRKILGNHFKNIFKPKFVNVSISN